MMSTYKKVFFIGLLLMWSTLTINNLYAQKQMNRCGTGERMEKLMEDAEFATKYNALKAKVANKTRSQKMQAPCVNPLIVPVVIHFESSTISNQCMIDASLAQVDQINTDFSGCNTNAGLLCDWINAGCNNFGGTAGANAMPNDGACIQFCLADENLPNDGNLIPGGFAITTSYIANFQNASTVWYGYLNIYVGDLGEDLGFVVYLGGGSNPNTIQGTSVLTSAFGSQFFSGCEGVGTNPYFGNGATLTHEIGHWFGLEHTFEDNLADTPPQNEPNFGCPGVNTNSCTSSEGSDYSGNFMDYVDDDCMFTFTQDQINIMLATAAGQSDWATNSVSCMLSYPPCGEANQAGACIEACPTTVITPINLLEETCGSTTLTSFPNPLNNGLAVDENSDLALTWSINNYLSNGGTIVSAPTIQTTTGCTIASKTYYLNVDCASSPLNTTLNGGTLVVRAYPSAPADVTSLIQISGENSCGEPMVTPVAGCESYIDIIADAGNPSFPVNTGDSGNTSYNVTFVPHPSGPACCTNTSNAVIIDAATNDGDLEIIGSGGNSPWTSTSTNFSTVMCSSSNCSSGNGTVNYGVAPNSGSWLAWFGGSNYSDVGTLRGSFTFPACPNGQTTLSFAFENSACGSSADFIELKVDGNIIWTYNTNPSNCDAPGTLQTINVDLSAYADGGDHILLFRAATVNSTGTNFTVDNINLVSEGCGTNSICDYIVTANYNCTSNCVSTLNLSNPHNLATTYQAAVSIQSNATVNADVDYRAGSRITLNPGFSVGLPHDFSADIGSCD